MWEKVARPGDARSLSGAIPIHHRYTLGVAGERFFREIRDGRRLLASRCPRCREAFLPPRMYCERCFKETEEWVPVDGPGYVKSFTVLHVSLDEQAVEEPVVVAIVAWEGIRGGLIHRVGDVAPDMVRTGMEVEPAWAEERTGSLDDIRHFRPSISR